MTLFVSRYGIILLDVDRSPELKKNPQASHNHNYIGQFTRVYIYIHYNRISLYSEACLN